MGKRGRPRHPDILTPREWDVLALLREGLSNPEIAERLDVSRDTVKTHVSDILGKLGVSTREEAASWRREEQRPWWAGVPVVGGGVAARAAGVAVAVAVLAGTGLLVWGLLRAGDKEGPYEGPVVAAQELFWGQNNRLATFRSADAMCGDGITAARYDVPRALRIEESSIGRSGPAFLGLEAEPYLYNAADVHVMEDPGAPEGWELSTRAGYASLLASVNRFSTGEVFLRRLDQPDALFRYNAGYCNESGAPRETPEPGLPGGGVPYTLPNDTPRVIEHVDGDYLSLGDALDQTHEARSEDDVLVAELGARTDLTLLNSVEWNLASGDENKVMWFFLVRFPSFGPTRAGEEFGFFAAVDATGEERLMTACCYKLLPPIDTNAMPSP